MAVDAVVYYRISNATIAVSNVEDYGRSTRLLAATTLRNVLGTKNLSEILCERENISHTMQVRNTLFTWMILLSLLILFYSHSHSTSRTLLIATYSSPTHRQIWTKVTCHFFEKRSFFHQYPPFFYILFQLVFHQHFMILTLYFGSTIPDDTATDPWGVKVERVEM